MIPLSVRMGEEGIQSGLSVPPNCSPLIFGMPIFIHPILVFGPSAEQLAVAQSVLAKEFPQCPICKAFSSYEVSGRSLDQFKCNTCYARWLTEPLTGGIIHSLTLVQPSGYDLRGIELAGVRYQTATYKNFDASYGAVLKHYRTQMTNTFSNVVSLEINEEVVWAWAGGSIVRLPNVLGSLASQLGQPQIAEHQGYLYLTSERLVWLQNGVFQFEVPLEDITSFAAADMYPESNQFVIILKSSKRNVESWLRLWLWYGTVSNVEVARDQRALNRVRGAIYRQQKIKRERLHREKQQERIQVILDFSSIKDTLAKGGVVATTIQCPQCAGPMSIPDTGIQTTCKYCGATVKPVDLFEKIKGLVS